MCAFKKFLTSLIFLEKIEVIFSEQFSLNCVGCGNISFTEGVTSGV